MESPLLTKIEHKIEVTSNADSSSNDHDQIVDMRAHHYDESSSTAEQTPHEAEGIRTRDRCIEKIIWNLIEFVVTLVQTFLAIVVLTLTKDEQKPHVVSLYPWIMCYTCASIASLCILCWRFWHNCRSESSASATIINGMALECLETILECFFLFWVLIFLWGVLVEPSCLDDTTQDFWLWVALLAFSCVRYVLPHLTFAVLCFSCPVSICIETFGDFIKRIIGDIRSFVYFIYGIFCVHVRRESLRPSAVTN